MTPTRYREGCWFAVPLQGYGYALGLVARASRGSHLLLGYFFGPAFGHLPTAADAAERMPANAVLMAVCGDESLLSGAWPVVPGEEPWEPSRWPMPDFGRYTPPSRYAPARGQRIRYREDDLEAQPEVTEISAEEAKLLPRSGWRADKGVELVLTALLIPEAALHSADQNRQDKPQGLQRLIRHYLEFSSKDAAEGVAKQLAIAGFAAQAHEAEGYWLVIAKRDIPTSEDALDAEEEDMGAVAKAWGGEYTGYERDVRPQ